MKYSNYAPWAQWVMGVVFSLFTIIAGLASFGMNVRFGLQTSVGTAVIFGLSDCLKIALPAMAVFVGWQLKTRVLYGVAILLSVVSAISFLLETQGNRLLEANHQAGIIKNATAEIERIRAELGGIAETATVAALKTMADEKKAAADREADRGFCGPICEGLKEDYANLLDRLGQAERRSKLEAQLTAALSTVKAEPEKAVGASNTVASLTGADKQTIGNGTAIFVAIFSLILLELAAMMSDNATGMLRQAYAASCKQVKTVKVVKVDMADTIEDKMTEAKALTKVQMMVWNSPCHQLISSRRELADTLGVAKSTFNDWTRRWETSGQIKCRSRGSKTVFTAERKQIA